MPVEPVLVSDDEDLIEATPVAPKKDPSTGRFVSSRPTPEIEQPEHTPYMLAVAQRFGITDAAQMSPAELSRLVTHLDRQQQQITSRRPEPEPEKKPEPTPVAIDWGTDEDGKAMSEKDYTPAIARAIKAAHAAEEHAKKADARAAAAEEKLTQAEQERNQAKAERVLQKKLATRPEVFGEKPGQAPDGSVEAERYKHVYRYLANLPKEERGQTFEADIEKAMAIFGAEPRKEVPAGKPAPSRLETYRNGETARPTNRRGTQELTRREQLIAEETAKRQEQGTYFRPGPDDDDLPD